MGDQTNIEKRLSVVERLVGQMLASLGSIKALAGKAKQDSGQSAAPPGDVNGDGFRRFQVLTDVPAASGATLGNGGSIRLLNVVSGVRVNAMNHDGSNQDIASPYNDVASIIVAKTYGIARLVDGLPTIIVADCNPAASFAADGAIP